jgi:hypothetical protein
MTTIIPTIWRAVAVLAALPAARRLVPGFVLLCMLAGCNDSRSQEGAFGQTGVIEGFYGPPWTHQDRLDVLRFMGRVGLTTYYYAPKDDPYHRERWREPYAPLEYALLGQAARTADSSGVTFVYAISPGGTMVYSDAEDFQRLVAKLNTVWALGVRDFALFLDDVPPTLQHEEDRATFANLAEAHAQLINRLHQDVDRRGGTLAVTPTTYTNAWGDRDYLRQLGESVHDDVLFFWTGVDVAAPEITAAQAREWGELISRKPLVWDNYPVNDFARWRLFLGPVRYRAADLGSAVAGILANPMNEAHASMLPLATLAEYVRDPHGYDPDSARARAVELLYGPGVDSLLDTFLHVYGDYPWHSNVFEPLFLPTNRFNLSSPIAASLRLQGSLPALDSAAARNADLQALLEELRPFVDRTARRIGAITRSAGFVRRVGAIAYRAELDRITARRARVPITVDGDPREWEEADWRLFIRPSSVGGTVPQVALNHDDEFLYVALEVRGDPPAVQTGHRIGEADHFAFVVQSDTATGRTQLGPEDLILLFAPPSASGEAMLYPRSLNIGGFVAKWLGDNHRLTFSEFQLATFGQDPVGPLAAVALGTRYAARRLANGYQAEVAIPLPNDGTPVRMNLTVAVTANGSRTVYALSRRSYAANPATFNEIVLGGGR